MSQAANKKSTAPKKNYNEDSQKLLIDVLLSSEDIYTRCVNILNPNYFVNKLRPAVRMIMAYTEKYHVLPKVEQVNAETNIDFQHIPNILPQHAVSFLEDIEEFCKNRALGSAVVEGAHLVEEGNYGELEKRIRDAMLICLQSDLGTDYFADPRARLMKIKDKNGQMSTGWKSLDDRLYGGWNRGELDIFVAGSGVGKSLFLQNLSLNGVRQGLHVVYISLELSEELTSMRLDSMLSEVATKEIFKNIDQVEIKVKQHGFKSGKLHIKQMPQGSRTNDLKAYLKNYAIQEGHMPDMLIVDYLDLMYPNDKRISAADLFIKDKYVSEELRGLAVEYNFVLLTASQLNRCLSPESMVICNGKNKKLSNVAVGDMLESDHEPVEVLEVLPVIKQPVFRITTKSGKEIMCSAKHKFPTNTGLKSLEDGLSVGEKLFVKTLGI
jgi:archaellum biogenesis ATPase FlaH